MNKQRYIKKRVVRKKYKDQALRITIIIIFNVVLLVGHIGAALLMPNYQFTGLIQVGVALSIIATIFGVVQYFGTTKIKKIKIVPKPSDKLR